MNSQCRSTNQWGLHIKDAEFVVEICQVNGSLLAIKSLSPIRQRIMGNSPILWHCPTFSNHLQLFLKLSFVSVSHSQAPMFLGDYFLPVASVTQKLSCNCYFTPPSCYSSCNYSLLLPRYLLLRYSPSMYSTHSTVLSVTCLISSLTIPV